MLKNSISYRVFSRKCQNCITTCYQMSPSELNKLPFPRKIPHTLNVDLL